MKLLLPVIEGLRVRIPALPKTEMQKTWDAERGKRCR